MVHVPTVDCPDSKVHGANMGPTWVLSAPDGPHVGSMDLAIRVVNIGSAPGHHYLNQCWHMVNCTRMIKLQWTLTWEHLNIPSAKCRQFYFGLFCVYTDVLIMMLIYVKVALVHPVHPIRHMSMNKGRITLLLSFSGRYQLCSSDFFVTWYIDYVMVWHWHSL